MKMLVRFTGKKFTSEKDICSILGGDIHKEGLGPFLSFSSLIWDENTTPPWQPSRHTTKCIQMQKIHNNNINPITLSISNPTSNHPVAWLAQFPFNSSYFNPFTIVIPLAG